ncbi:aldo/keto reductase [Seonamhaeicola maritimus]|uniref:Aldo/keto reductase n=1 Tax=Seonamhaeicola maritimus TaxID=2591822 RepID=A0A5C7GJK6_9FLAO|nr:aldo/keto reductase [Seonamhaeicola maritimus]TXG37375.1 aldo/keto reductase [Seonamhaeicola maritimus]
MKTLKLSNNDEMPAFGLGTWKSAEGDVYNAVKTAIKNGYRHIDCAAAYGNESEVGKALSEAFNEGVVKRENIWITSKVWCNMHAKDDVIEALKQTLSDLQLEYLDLYLVHWPIAQKKEIPFVSKVDDFISLEELPNEVTWEGMEKAVELGLTKHIGVSNFGPKALQQLISSAKIKPEMNQIESHPYFQQIDMISLCKSNNMHVTAYAPLGSGDRAAKFKAEDEPKLLEDPVILEIAASKNATPGQILISWALHRGTSVIPKSVNSGRIVQNFEAQNVDLSESDMAKIKALDENYRFLTGEHWVYEGSPYTLESIWE